MRRLWLLLGVVAGCIGCSRDKPVEVSPVKRITISLAAAEILVGASTQANATLLDENDNAILDRTAAWSSQTPAVVSVDQGGRVTGLQPGTGVVRAASGSVSAVAIVIVKNPLAATITLNRDTATIFVPTGSVQLFPTVRDEAGAVLQNPNIVWTSAAPVIAAVNSAGLVTAVASGTTPITGTIDGQSAQIQVTVRPSPNALAPAITAIAPAVLRPGAAHTITGTNFAPTPGGNLVLVDGIPATVQTASATQLAIVLATGGYLCDPSHLAYVQVTAAGQIGGGAALLSAPYQRNLAPGQSVLVTSGPEVRCNELSQAGGRYAISVYAASRAAITPTSASTVNFQVRGALAADATLQPRSSRLPGTSRLPVPAVPSSPPSRLVVPRIGGREFAIAEDLRRMRDRDAAHARVVERSIDAARGVEVRSLLAPGAGAPRDPRIALQLSTPGSITPLKLPNVDAADLCATSFSIGARTIYVGAHSIIVEDTASIFNGRATLAGQMDAYYTRLGDEFENVMWPIITTNFGNPLAMDAQLGNIGKVVMLFSPRVNAMLSGNLLGFAASCDFFPVATKPSSNLGSFFYAYVPTSSAPGYATETRDQWLRQIRSTVIHELKHVTSFAERLSRSLPLEDISWEEGMARISEEMFARAIYGTQARQNTGFAATISCDIKYIVGPPPCTDRPILMLRHFDAMYSYLGLSEVYSPLGRSFSGDVTFYAVAWSMLRWAADHSTLPEAQFFRDFTASAVTGSANLEARTARNWEDLLGEWSLALFVDDLADYTPENPRLKIPSWNFVDIFTGMCSEMGPCISPLNGVQIYTRNPPYNARVRSFGTFLLGVGAMTGGGWTIVDLGGTATGVQVIEVRSFQGTGDPPASVRLAITRIR